MQSPVIKRNFKFTKNSHRSLRYSFTLVELLVATVISLLLFAALLQAFKSIGDSVVTARATMEMSGQLRSVTHRLREDLKGVTVPMRPWTRPSAGVGHFEYVEGAANDLERVVPNQPNPTLLEPNPFTTAGDGDDVLMFTSRSDAEPFVGRFVDDTGVTVIRESRVAEITWWSRFDASEDDSNGNGTWDPGEQRTLHRRVLLVRPDLEHNNGRILQVLIANVWTDVTTPALMRQFYNENDISVRPVRNAVGAVIGIVANSLSDLTKRENRFAHYPVVTTTGSPPQFAGLGVGFPFPLDVQPNVPNPNLNNPTSLVNLVLFDDSAGQDIIASNIVAFDVRVYDPLAPIIEDQSPPLHALSPGDKEYDNQWGAGATVIGYGAFVDLNYADDPTVSQFSGPGRIGPYFSTYCTWSFHYEHDGFDQNPTTPPLPIPLIDEGTDGLDNNALDGVDDIGERETSPPYPRPLRGLKVSIRMLEPDTERVQQFSVVQDFTPE